MGRRKKEYFWHEKKVIFGNLFFIDNQHVLLYVVEK